MPVINGVYLKDFAALPSAVVDANIIPIAITGNQIAYRTTVGGIVTDARVTSKLLTGLSVTGGAVVATDTILQAFGKVQNQINSKVSSVGLTMPAAFNVANSPITSAGTLAVTAIGAASQYIRGDGALADFPTTGGGGSSVAYYLNGSVSQGTFVGNTYYEMNKTPVIGTGTDFTIGADGYIAQFITDANDPASLLIPAGNWNVEMYFSASSSGGTPSFYVEVYKYNGTTFTLLGSSATTPEGITNGTAIDIYYTSVGIPETVLAITDRLAIRVYVTHSGRTITLHTEDNHLSEIVTTFSNGLTALNGLTKQAQYFAVGSTGTDFNISSSVDTHTFNIPDASASNRGLITTGSQTIAGTKTFSVDTVVNGVNIGTGGGNIASNTRIGQNAGLSNTTGYNNSFIGYSAGYNNTTGQRNSFIGMDSGYGNTTGSGNLFIGLFSGSGNTTGNGNSFIGNSAGVSSLTGSANLFIGADAGSYISGGTVFNTISNNSVFIGNSTKALADNQTNQTVIGFEAIGLGSNTTVLGNSSTVFGRFWGNLLLGDSSNTGQALQVTGNAKITGTITNGTYTYTLPSATGTLALTSDIHSAVTLSAIGSTPNANGATLTGQILNLEPASASYGGVVTTGTQTFAGQKTFIDAVILNSTLNLTSGALSIIYNPANTAYWQTYVDSSNVFNFGFNGTNVKASITSGGNITGVTGTFTGQLTLGSTITNGTYTYTLPSATGTLALTSALSGYLPLTGGTLTGALSGTSATFSGNTETLNLFIGTSTTLGFSGAKLFMKSANALDYNGAVFQSSTNSNSVTIAHTGTIGRIASTYGTGGTGTFTDLTFATSGVDRLTIASTGAATFSSSVGLGTSNLTGQSSDNRVLQIYGAGTANRAQIHLVNSNTGEASTDGTFLGIDSSGEFFIVNKEAAATVFENNGSERMRITSGGNLEFTGASTNSKIKFWNSYSGTPTCVGFEIYNASATTMFAVNGNGGSVFSAILGTGIVYSSGGTLTSTNPSDKRLKNNITNLKWGLKEILQLRPVEYNWKEDKINQGKQFGFIAQEVNEIMPEAIKEFGEDIKYLGLEKEAIYAALVKAIQEQQAQIEELKALIKPIDPIVPEVTQEPIIPTDNNLE
jgi:hypothetical protein